MTQFDNAKKYLATHFVQPSRIEEVKAMIYLSGNPAARSQAALITLILDLPVAPDNVPPAPQG